MRVLLFFILITSLLPAYTNAQDVTVVRYNISETYTDPNQQYHIDLLTLVLDAARHKHGEYELVPVKVDMLQGRASLMLQKGKLIDIMWRMTSKALEKDLQAIYVPLLKGLMGARIAIIRKDDEHIFTPSMTLPELKAMSAGQGYDWPDSEILRANGFDVIEGSAFSLLSMLERKRFDYFPRAIHEPWIEIEGKPQFEVEPYFLLKYPAPIYFFINKANHQLAERLRDGFAEIIASGQFDEFFLQHPITENILLKANLPQRKILILQNPLLSEKSRQLLNNKSLWLNYFN